MKNKSDEYYMNLALKEAKKGVGRTSPNPCVGAVIVKEGVVISVGYHRKAGTPHAEIHALKNAGEMARDATMYVTLEPCNHTGRTPPCSHAVAAAGLKRVVIGMLDPNPLVNGSGASYLRQKEIKVESGVLEDRCRNLNRPFLKLLSSSLPLVTMKAGISLDGRLSYQKGCRGAITGVEAHRKVHRMRDQTGAILVGIGTIMTDDPSLTTRLPNKRGKDPVRIVLDSTLKINESAQVLNLDSLASTWIFCSKDVDSSKVERLVNRGVVIHFIERNEKAGIKLNNVLKIVAKNDYSSVLVEGGSTIHGAFLREKLVDRVTLFYAPVFAGDQGVPLVNGIEVKGGKEDAICLAEVTTRRYGDDIMISGDVIYPK